MGQEYRILKHTKITGEEKWEWWTIQMKRTDRHWEDVKVGLDNAMTGKYYSENLAIRDFELLVAEELTEVVREWPNNSQE